MRFPAWFSGSYIKCLASPRAYAPLSEPAWIGGGRDCVCRAAVVKVFSGKMLQRRQPVSRKELMKFSRIVVRVASGFYWRVFLLPTFNNPYNSPPNKPGIWPLMFQFGSITTKDDRFVPEHIRCWILQHISSRVNERRLVCLHGFLGSQSCSQSVTQKRRCWLWGAKSTHTGQRKNNSIFCEALRWWTPKKIHLLPPLQKPPNAGPKLFSFRSLCFTCIIRIVVTETRWPLMETFCSLRYA